MQQTPDAERAAETDMLIHVSTAGYPEDCICFQQHLIHKAYLVQVPTTLGADPRTS